MSKAGVQVARTAVLDSIQTATSNTCQTDPLQCALLAQSFVKVVSTVHCCCGHFNYSQPVVLYFRVTELTDLSWQCHDQLECIGPSLYIAYTYY